MNSNNTNYHIFSYIIIYNRRTDLLSFFLFFGSIMLNFVPPVPCICKCVSLLQFKAHSIPQQKSMSRYDMVFLRILSLNYHVKAHLYEYVNHLSMLKDLTPHLTSFILYYCCLPLGLSVGVVLQRINSCEGGERCFCSQLLLFP